MTSAGLVVILWIAPIASAITQQQLATWCSSQTGLGMSSADASALAAKQYRTLTECGVTVQALQGLRDTMNDNSKLGLALDTIRQQIWLLAEQHIAPDKLSDMFYYLYSSYTIHGGLGLQRPEAQQRAVDMVLARAEPDNLKALYQVMYGYSGLGFDKATATREALREALAGTDADQFKEVYTRTRSLDQAIDLGVGAYLSGLVRRYAKDGSEYTAAEFQKYYSQTWLAEWLAAPLEKKVSDDRQAYTASQFSRHYGSNWAVKYRASQEATQQRLADDGKPYAIKDFQSYYGAAAWQRKWTDAPELACVECKPYLVPSGGANIVV